MSYNTRALTLDCLRSVYAQTARTPFELLVVDNASSDDSAAAIEREFPEVRLIRPGVNLGFAAANNLAARKARGRWLLLLNPDTVVLDGAIQKLHAFGAAHTEADIFGGRTYFADGTLNPTSCWARATPWSAFCRGVGLSAVFPNSRWFDPEALGDWPRDTAREVDIVTGCFFLIRKRLWDRLDGFDPAFFMYGEEADLCLRAAALGVRRMICPDARIIHYGGASETVRADKIVRLCRAKAQLFRRHWSPAAALWGIAMLDLWALTRLLAYAGLRLVRPARRTAYDTWRNIWRRRSAWRSAALGVEPLARHDAASA